MTTEEIKKYKILESIKVESLESIKEQALNKMVDKNGEQYLALKIKTDLEDPFPRWFN